MKPITRKEYYLAKAAGTYTGPTPPPVLREDYYLATLAGDYPGNCPAPVTRIEKYMSAAAGLTSYVPQPVTRIEKYWYAIAKGTGYVPEPVTREEKFLYAILKNPPKPEYLDKTAEGNPILLTDSAEAPLTALTVYGHSTQDGTPSPENPVPIVSAGDEGEINVEVLGGNLVDESINNWKCTGWVSDMSGIQEIENGMKITAYNGWLNVYRVVPDYLVGKTVTILFDYRQIAEETTSGDSVHVGYGSFNIISTKELSFPSYTDVKWKVTEPAESLTNVSVTFICQKYIGFFIYLSEETTGLQRVIEVTNIMLNVGSTALPYMPYKQPQTLTLSTPGGLPGIPVSSGGNYTDESGQQWICDEVDLKRGKYVQRVGEVELDGTEAWVLQSGSGDLGQPYFYLGNSIDCETLLKGYSNYFPVDSIQSNNAEQGVGGWETTMYLRWTDMFSTVEDLKSFLSEKYTSGNPVRVYYILATPIETDLPAEEIAAYKALHTYSPTTTVSNDAGAWMKVGYKANT